MAKLIALEWDQNELRLAAGSRHGSTVSIDVLVATSLASDTPLSPDEFDSKLASALTKLVASHGLTRSEVIVAAGRAAVELRGLSLPPSDDNDLPDLVRFAAQRAFAQLGDNWPIDFIKFPTQQPDSTQVLASAISSTLVNKIKKIVEQAGLSPKSIMLRPLASTALAMVAHPSMRNQASLIVNLVGDEADLLVAEDGVANVIRTSRLPEGNEESRRRAIASEIKRTWLASESQTPTMKPTQLVLWGDVGCGVDVVQQLSESTKLPTVQVKLKNAAQLPTSLPEADIERFVPVVGMLWQAIHGDHHAFDFLHPRQRIEVKTPAWKKIGAAAAAGLLVATGIWWYFAEHRYLQSEITRLTTENNKLDQPLKVAEAKRADWDKVVNFLRTDVQWLDQLAYLSDRSLPAEKMYLFGTPNFAIDPQSNTSSITLLNAAAKNGEDLSRANAQFRDANHNVTPSKTNMVGTGSYRYVENLQVVIQPKTKEEFEKLLADAALKQQAEASQPEKVSPPADGSPALKESEDKSDAGESKIDAEESSESKGGAPS